jgi:hypothetical protein
MGQKLLKNSLHWQLSSRFGNSSKLDCSQLVESSAEKSKQALESV